MHISTILKFTYSDVVQPERFRWSFSQFYLCATIWPTLSQNDDRIKIYLYMHKFNESFCFAEISPSSWNSIFGLWHVWNCSMCPFDFFSWCRIFFLKGNVRSEFNQRSEINKTTLGKILKDSHWKTLMRCGVFLTENLNIKRVKCKT